MAGSSTALTKTRRGSADSATRGWRPASPPRRPARRRRDRRHETVDDSTGHDPRARSPTISGATTQTQRGGHQLLQLRGRDRPAADKDDAAAGEVEKQRQQHKKKSPESDAFRAVCGFWSLCSFELEGVQSMCDRTVARRARQQRQHGRHRLVSHNVLFLQEPEPLSQVFQWFAATLRIMRTRRIPRPTPLAAGLMACVLTATPARADRAARGRRSRPLRPERSTSTSRAHGSGRRDDSRREQQADANGRAARHRARVREVTILRTGSATQKATVSLDEPQQTATLTVPRPLPKGPAEIHIRYTGILNDELRGFYLSQTPDGATPSRSSKRPTRGAPFPASTSRRSRRRSTSRSSSTAATLRSPTARHLGHAGSRRTAAHRQVFHVAEDVLVPGGDDGR